MPGNRNPFELAAQVLLHRLVGQSGAGGELVAHRFRDVAYGDLNSHAVIMTPLLPVCNHPRAVRRRPS